MARKQLNVAVKDVDPGLIPEHLVPGGVMLVDLEARGAFDKAGVRLKVRRQGGYPALDLWILCLLYHSCGGQTGLKKWWKGAQAHAVPLGAAAGRLRLPSPSSVSRGLGAMEEGLVREAASWMLTEVVDVDAMLRHPTMFTYDTRGQAWHVFDLDPHVTPLHQRGLPEDADLPEPQRRSEDTGKPGYTGRKRGNVQFRRMDVQHAGSGLWVHAHLHRGNGDGVADLDLAFGSVTGLLGRLKHPRSRAMVRMDGEFGSMPFFSYCRQHQLPFITRLNRPKLFEDPAILNRLRAAIWLRVPDSLSGPTRSAAELGTIVIHPGRDTRRPDGTTYDPISVRVVVSIFPRKGRAKHGRVIDGWQVELFAVDLPADAWPAPEAICAYYGRSGQENRLAQEDREVRLDRILSYELAGQEFATLTGLFLLNYRTVRGFELETPPAVRPASQLRRPLEDERVPRAWPRDPELIALLDRLECSTMLDRHPGWRWASGQGGLQCPDGEELALTTVRPKTEDASRTGVIFCGTRPRCTPCPKREACLPSARPKTAKHVQFSVPSEVADLLRARLEAVRAKTAVATELESMPTTAVAGIHDVQSPLFLPREARVRCEEGFDHARLQISLTLPPPAAPRPRLVAADVATRQHRRQTWAQRNLYNKLPEDAVVGLTADGRPDLSVFLDLGSGSRGEVRQAS